MPEIVSNPRQPPDSTTRRSTQNIASPSGRESGRKAHNTTVVPILIGGSENGKVENSKFIIKEVWSDNLDEEFDSLRQLVTKYPYIAMDTEFPGVVAKPLGNYRTTADYHYQTLRCNVDLLKIIQLGLTFADSQGRLPESTCTWQFNFKFSLTQDMYAQDSIDLLSNSGIDFQRHENNGIDIDRFGELLVTSGFILTDSVKWISFHSGYDFGYLLKMITCAPLPSEEPDFFDVLRLYFPCIYDVKYMMKSTKNLKGGLQDVADDLSIERIGPQHQAGSDSLLTCITFFKMCEQFFRHQTVDKYIGHLYGLGTTLSGISGGHVASLATPILQSSVVSPSTSGHLNVSHHLGSPTMSSISAGPQNPPATGHHYYRAPTSTPTTSSVVTPYIHQQDQRFASDPTAYSAGAHGGGAPPFTPAMYSNMNSRAVVPPPSLLPPGAAQPHAAFPAGYDMMAPPPPTAATAASGATEVLSNNMSALNLGNSGVYTMNSPPMYANTVSNKMFNGGYPSATGSSVAPMWSAHHLSQSAMPPPPHPGSAGPPGNMGVSSTHLMNNKAESH